MTDETIRQAASALIDRKAETGEWVNTTDVCRVLLGREPTSHDWHIPPDPADRENVGAAWNIVRVLRALAAEEQLEHRGHLGWRKAPNSQSAPRP